MVGYYEPQTSPRKLEPEYRPQRRVQPSKQPDSNVSKRRAQQQKAKAKSKNRARILYIVAGFIVLLTISFRYALINTSFKEKEKLKSQLSEIQKQNQQLKVSIEQGTNINTLEQEARERLGMQKLDNNQKVYVNLDKSDYIESSAVIETEDEADTWWSKLLKDLFNINS